MSDLFKRHRPRMTEDEDRELFARVREQLRPAAAAAPWWRSLLAAPAVRYGAPALAVALVAVVWVVQQSPTPPARERAPAPAAPAPAIVAPVRDASAPPSVTVTPSAPVSGEASREESPAFAKPPGTKSEGTIAETESKATGNEALAQRAAPQAADEAPDAAGSRPMARMAPPPPSAAVGTTTAPAPTAAPRPAPTAAKERALRAYDAPAADRSDESVAGDDASAGSAERLAAVLAPAAGEAVLETVRLPFSGGTAWIATGRGLEGTLEADGDAEVLLAAPGARTTRTAESRVTIQAGGSRVAVIAVSGEGQASFIGLDGRERTMPAVQAGARAQRAALGVELLIAQQRGDRAGMTRVRDEAVRLAAARPRDAGVRALVEWSAQALGFSGGAGYR